MNIVADFLESGDFHECLLTDMHPSLLQNLKEAALGPVLIVLWLTS